MARYDYSKYVFHTVCAECEEPRPLQYSALKWNIGMTYDVDDEPCPKCGTAKRRIVKVTT